MPETMKKTKERFLLHAPAAVGIAAAVLQPAVSEEALRAAVERGVRRFEGLCGKLAQRDDGSAEFLSGPPVIEIGSAPLESEYDWFEAAEQLRARPMDVSAGEFVRFRLLLGAEKTELICALHCAAGDARSLLLLLESICAALEHPELTLKTLPRETADPESLIGKKLSGMPAMMVNMCNKRWIQQGRAFTRQDFAKICEKEEELPPPVVCFRTFPQEMTAKIGRVCEEQGITPEDAAMAALTLALGKPCEINRTCSLRGAGEDGFGDLSTAAALAGDPRGTDLIPLAKRFAQNRMTADSDPARKYFLMRFLTGADPGLLDAVWYQTYGLIRHPMVGQMADLLSFGSRARDFSLTDAGRLGAGAGKYRMEELRLLAAHYPDALRTATMAACGGLLTVTMQFADDGEADDNAALFEDAMDMLEEMTV